MTDIFADTSALYALLDRHDRAHGRAAAAFDRIDRQTMQLITSSYVLLESVSLIQARLGLAAAREWRDRFQPLLEVVWIDAGLHGRGMAALLAASRRDVSLTDWTSFEVMRDRHVTRAFAFDPHFLTQGFELLT